MGDPGTWPGQACSEDGGAGGGTGAGTPALSAGISLKVLQVIVVTERVSVPRMVADGGPGCSEAGWPPAPGYAARSSRSKTGARDQAPPPRAPRRAPPVTSTSWVPTETDIKSALSRLRKVPT
jgi:hypothetical protein